MKNYRILLFSHLDPLMDRAYCTSLLIILILPRAGRAEHNAAW